MTAAESYSIAGIGAFALLTLWFLNVYQILSRKKKDVFHAGEQVRLLRECFRRLRNSPEEASAGRILEKSIQTYLQKEKIYNETFLKPTCRFLGSLMGFRRAESSIESQEKDTVICICEDCGFTFHGAEGIRECPYCGKQRIHASSEEEIEKLQFILQSKLLDTFH